MKCFSHTRVWLQLIVAVGLSVSSCLAQQTGNPFDLKLQSVAQKWNKAKAPAKAVLLGQISDLREFVTDPKGVTNQLSNVANRSDEPALIRDEANWRLAQIALHEGRLDDAHKISDSLGFLRDWTQVLTSGCSTAKFVGNASLKPGPLASVTVHTPGTVCVATAVYSPSAQNVAIRFGADGPVSIYLNRSLITSSRDLQAFAFDQNSLGVRLQAGWNTISLELQGSNKAKQFGLRLTSSNGGGVSLTTDSSRLSGNPLPVNKVSVTDLLLLAHQSNGNAEALDTISALKKLRGLGNDLDRLGSAAKLAPSADRWVAVAEACPEQSCTLAALNRALQADPQDASAKAALADYYFNRGQLEKSRDLLREVIAREPNNFVAQKRLADVYASTGLASQAIAEYRKLESSGPLPIWLKRELALKYEDLGLTGKAASLLNQVWKVSFDDTTVVAALVEMAERRADMDALLMLAQSAETLDPMDPQVQLELAQYGSRPMRLEAVGISEAHKVHVRDEDTVAFGAKTQVRPANYDPSIDSSHRLTPANEDDSEYLINPVKLAADAHRNAPPEDSNVVSLAEVSVERVQPNGQSTVHAQQVFYIANDRGARDYAVRSVQYSNATQKLSLIAAKVYKSDGRVLDADDQGESSVADITMSMYYDTRSRSVRFPRLEKGDVIALEYRIAPNSNVNPYGNYFGTLVAFQTGLAQHLRRYVLVAPVQRKLNVVEQRMPARATVTKNAREVVYRWDAANIAPLSNEPRGPALTEVAPYLSISTFGDWSELGEWYAHLITPQFTLNGDLRDALKQITADAKTEPEKVHAIHEFVLRNTHYVAMEFGVYSYKPYPVSQVYARRFGDCKDKASLMIALMRASGIDAELALVRTRKLGDVSDRATSIAIFNHAVAYIPKYDLWLDGTAEYAGSRELPLDDQGAMALTVNLNGDATLRRIPVTQPMQNYTRRVVTAEVQQDGNIRFSGTAYTRGEDAPGLRREYELADRQRDTVRANLAQIYPSVRVDSVHVEGAHDIERDIHVKFSGSLDKFAGNKVLALTSSWLPHQYVSSLASLNSRSQDLVLPAPWTTEEELHFLVPEGTKIESLPANTSYDTKFGNAAIHYEQHGRELIVTTSVQFRSLRIAPDEYGAFRDFCSQVEKAFRAEMKVRLAG